MRALQSQAYRQGPARRCQPWLAMVSMFRPAVGFYSHEDKSSDSVRRASAPAPSWDCRGFIRARTDGSASAQSPIAFGRGPRPQWAIQSGQSRKFFQTLTNRATNHDAVEASLIDWLTNETRRGFQEGAGRARAMLPGESAERSR